MERTRDLQVNTLMERILKVTSPDGKLLWAMVPWEDWQGLMDLLEDLMDIRLMEEVEQSEDFIPWDEAEQMLEAGDVPD